MGRRRGGYGGRGREMGGGLRKRERGEWQWVRRKLGVGRGCGERGGEGRRRG